MILQIFSPNLDVVGLIGISLLLPGYIAYLAYKDYTTPINIEDNLKLMSQLNSPVEEINNTTPVVLKLKKNVITSLLII